MTHEEEDAGHSMLFEHINAKYTLHTGLSNFQAVRNLEVPNVLYCIPLSLQILTDLAVKWHSQLTVL